MPLRTATGKVKFEKGFLTRRDINGDGIEDFILDYGHFICRQGSTYYCGSAGCLTQVFASLSNGKFVKVLDENVRGKRSAPIGAKRSLLGRPKIASAPIGPQPIAHRAADDTAKTFKAGGQSRMSKAANKAKPKAGKLA